MATQLENKAKEAFVDDDFELAVELYTQVIGVNPKSADLFADRAQANIKLHNFTEAVADANKAIELDPAMVKAYLRKGTACIKLEEHHTAKTALEVGQSLAPHDARFVKLIKECDDRIVEETKPRSLSNTTAKTVEEELTPITLKYRHEYYQKPEEVVVTVFAKGVAAKDVVVDFGEQLMSVTIHVLGEITYHFQPRLFGKIIPDKCRYEVLSTKIEIHLAKAEAIQWTSLEFSKEVTVTQKLNVSSVGSHRPRYPSSKSNGRDWDKLEALVKKEEKDEKLEGDAGVNKFFRDIYADVDEDTKRAMMKSFYESNGTVLSTDWKEVGSKKIECSPPEGLESNKW